MEVTTSFGSGRIKKKKGPSVKKRGEALSSLSMFFISESDLGRGGGFLRGKKKKR